MLPRTRFPRNKPVCVQVRTGPDANQSALRVHGSGHHRCQFGRSVAGSSTVQGNKGVDSSAVEVIDFALYVDCLPTLAQGKSGNGRSHSPDEFGHFYLLCCTKGPEFPADPAKTEADSHSRAVRWKEEGRLVQGRG